MVLMSLVFVAIHFQTFIVLLGSQENASSGNNSKNGLICIYINSILAIIYLNKQVLKPD